MFYRESVQRINDRLLSLLSESVKTYVGVEDAINRKLTQVVRAEASNTEHVGDAMSSSVPNRVNSPSPGRVMSPSPGRVMSPAPGRVNSPARNRVNSPAPGKTNSQAPGRISSPAPERLSGKHGGKLVFISLFPNKILRVFHYSTTSRNLKISRDIIS